MPQVGLSCRLPHAATRGVLCAALALRYAALRWEPFSKQPRRRPALQSTYGDDSNISRQHHIQPQLRSEDGQCRGGCPGLLGVLLGPAQICRGVAAGRFNGWAGGMLHFVVVGKPGLAVLQLHPHPAPVCFSWTRACLARCAQLLRALAGAIPLPKPPRRPLPFPPSCPGVVARVYHLALESPHLPEYMQGDAQMVLGNLASSGMHDWVRRLLEGLPLKATPCRARCGCGSCVAPARAPPPPGVKGHSVVRLRVAPAPFATAPAWCTGPWHLRLHGCPQCKALHHRSLCGRHLPLWPQHLHDAVAPVTLTWARHLYVGHPSPCCAASCSCALHCQQSLHIARPTVSARFPAAPDEFLSMAPRGFARVRRTGKLPPLIQVGWYVAT